MEQSDSKPLYIGGRKDLSSSVQRTAGYLDALQAQGYKAQKSDYILTEFSEDGGYTGMLKIINQHEQPISIFCGNFSILCGALRACKENHLDIGSIYWASFDHHPLLAYIRASILYLEQDYQQMAQKSLSLLLSGKQSTKENFIINNYTIGEYP